MGTDRFNETEAARRLGISKGTLARERLAGRIRPIRIGPRIIHYTQAILDEYELWTAAVADRWAAQQDIAA